MKQHGGVLPFLLGFILAAAALWILFPQVIYSAKEQPFRFSHQVHVEGQGMVCEDCHYFRDDGSYAGFPSNEECSMCHDVGDPQEVIDMIVAEVGEDGNLEDILKPGANTEELDSYLMSSEPEDLAAEREFVVKYLVQGIEPPWYNYQYQPDNVFFSHKAHAGITEAMVAAAESGEHMEAVEESDEPNCNLCHPAGIDTGSTPPPFYENVITGYSKQTMKMWQCEECHARMHQANACYVCHK